MGDLILPSFPGADIAYERVGVFTSNVQNTPSGRETSISYESYPRYEWTITFNALREYLSAPEATTLASLFAQLQGRGSYFLFSDPEMCSVVDMGFGVGNGSATAFQLQRALQGTLVRDGMIGTPQLLPDNPRTNLLSKSQDVATWGTSISGSGVTPAKTVDYCVAPDGTVTADRIVYDIGAGVAGTDWSVTNSPSASGTIIGRTYTVSVWLRNNDGSGTKIIRLDNNSATKVLCNVTAVWQRFQLSFVATLGANHTCRLLLLGNDGTAKYADLSVWGAQLEEGSSATDYIATTTVPVRVDPAFWPASNDGFEPVWYPDRSLPLSIYQRDFTNVPQLLSPFPRTNFTPKSAQLDDATWTKFNAGTGVAPVVTANAATAPDGTVTADRVQLDKGVGGTSGDSSGVYSPTNALTPGKPYVASIWLRGNTTNSTFRLTILNGTSVSIQDLTLTLSWQRYFVTFVCSAGATNNRLYMLSQGSLAGEQQPDFYAWGAQIEEGSVPGLYIPTTTAAVTQTDYSLNTSGGVTMAVPPPTGAGLSWTGNYRYRCRLLDDRWSMARVFSTVWESSFNFRSVKP